MAKKVILEFIAGIVIKLGLLPIILYLANRWCIEKKQHHSPTFPFVKRRKQPHYQILLYHRVDDERDPFFGGTPVKVFERQMEMLQR